MTTNEESNLCLRLHKITIRTDNYEQLSTSDSTWYENKNLFYNLSNLHVLSTRVCIFRSLNTYNSCNYGIIEFHIYI